MYLFQNILFVYLILNALGLHTWPDSLLDSVKIVTLMWALKWWSYNGAFGSSNDFAPQHTASSSIFDDII